MILETADHPDWVHQLLRALLERKLRFIEESLAGAKFDLIETGGGAARESATCNTSTLARMSYVLVFAAGLVAIGYEIIWYRIIGVLVKDSPYAFSKVLSVCLAGVAFGSLGIRKYLACKANSSHRDLFFTIQFLIGFTVLLIFGGYYYLSKQGPVGWLITMRRGG